jgi:hypothetical protein
MTSVEKRQVDTVEGGDAATETALRARLGKGADAVPSDDEPLVRAQRYLLAVRTRRPLDPSGRQQGSEHRRGPCNARRKQTLSAPARTNACLKNALLGSKVMSGRHLGCHERTLTKLREVSTSGERPRG